MSANQEIIAELRRVLNERDEAREQLDLTKRELGRWVDRETKAVRERDEARDKHEALAVLVDGYRRERDEARAEAALALAERDGALCRQEDLEADVRYYEDRWESIIGGAYRRGAEAMRETCLGVVERFMDFGSPHPGMIAHKMSALPIPEEP